MSQSPTPESPSLQIHRIAGWMLALCFFGLATTQGGYTIIFRGPFTFLAPGELKLWLGSALFLFPACCLLGFGYRPALEPWLNRLHQRLRELTPRRRAIGLLLVTVLAMILARFFNAVILHGYPVTDDEYAARFGGETLADGRLFVTPDFPLQAVPYLFLFVKGKSLAGMDWTGAQLAWTIATLTRSGNWIFALSAAVPVGGLAFVLHRRLGIGWAAFGVLLFLMSPMAWSLSMTTHGHLHSRAFLSLALVAFVLAWETPSRKRWFALGWLLGLAFICRPYETSFMGTPCLLILFRERLRTEGKNAFPEIAAIIIGGLIPLLGFCVHSWAITHSLIPPRQAAGSTGVPIYEPSPWVRFGSNCGFNLFLLCVYFAGPLGIALVAAGVLMNGLTRTLGVSVVGVLLLGLFHDNYGVHIVGPIHYSECVVPLTVIAVHGLARITRAFRDFGLNQWIPVSMASVWLILGLGVFNAIHGNAMGRQAELQEIVYQQIEVSLPKNTGRKSVILAPQFMQIRNRLPEFPETGSWVHEWRRPKPDFSDDILILHDVQGTQDAIRKAFPERTILRMTPTDDGSLFRLTPLEELRIKN